jgi:hypothetical protein
VKDLEAISISGEAPAAMTMVLEDTATAIHTKRKKRVATITMKKRRRRVQLRKQRLNHTMTRRNP